MSAKKRLSFTFQCPRLLHDSMILIFSVVLEFFHSNSERLFDTGKTHWRRDGFNTGIGFLMKSPTMFLIELFCS